MRQKLLTTIGALFLFPLSIQSYSSSYIYQPINLTLPHAISSTNNVYHLHDGGHGTNGGNGGNGSRDGHGGDGGNAQQGSNGNGGNGGVTIP